MVLLALLLIGLLLSGPIALAVAIAAHGRIARFERRAHAGEARAFVPTPGTGASAPPDPGAEDAPPRPQTEESTSDLRLPGEEAAAEPVVSVSPDVSGAGSEDLGLEETRARIARGLDEAPSSSQAAPMAGAPGSTGWATSPTPAGWSWREIEEAIGTRWAVWLGGLAIAIGGALLVRQMALAGLFGPAARIVAGYALALATGLAAERMRRSEGVEPTQHWPRIPAVLTGAALMIAFATTYAAYGLYGFIGAGVTLVLLGGLGVGALALSERYGEPMAGLGLLGALGAPLLLGNGSGIGQALTLYLPVVAGTGYVVAIRRRWITLMMATAAGSLAWAFGLYTVSGSAVAAELDLLAQAVLTLVALEKVMASGMLEEVFGRREVIAVTSGVIAIVAAIVLAQTSAVPNVGWPLVGLALVAILLAYGMRRPVASASAMAATALMAAMIVGWPFELVPAGAFVAVATMVPIGILVACVVRLLRSRGLDRVDATVYAAAGAGAPALSILAVETRWDRWPSEWAVTGSSPGWSAFALLAAAACAVASTLLRKRPESETHARQAAAGIMAAGAATSVALAAWLGLSGTSLLMAFSVATAASALIDRRWRIPELRWYAGALALWLAGHIGMDPVGAAHVEGLSVSMGIAVAYGLPATAFALASRWLGQGERRDDAPTLACWSLALLLSAAAVFLEIHQAMHGGMLNAPVEGLAETGLLTVFAAGYAGALTGYARGASGLRKGAYQLAFGASQLCALAGTLLIANPLITRDAIQGGALANDIALGYALPAIALFGLGRLSWKAGLSSAALVARASATLLVFAYATLSIRFWFHGPSIGDWSDTTGQLESLCYSAAWLAIGVGILVYGIARRSFSARLASGGFVFASVLKVFLIDLAGVDGPGRAVSFILLGAVLIGIGLLYQKVVFAPSRDADKGHPSP